MRTGLAVGLLASLAACGRGASSGAPAAIAHDLGLASRGLVGDGSLWLVRVLEADQGGVDGNSDGDAEDELVFVVDRAHGRVLAPGLALATRGGPEALLACDGEAAAFAVDEGAQGRDLDGDGDALDRVLFVLDREHGVVRNVGRAIRALAVGGALVAFSADEAAEGSDLDGDGDATGGVLRVLDLRDDSITEFSLRDSTPLAVHDDHVALVLAEREGLDMTLDGDDDDALVFEVYDGRRRLLHNTTLVLASPVVSAAGGTFGFSVSEAAQRRDLSGDGDRLDDVFHVYDPALGFSHNLGLSVPLYPPPAVAGERYLLYALEEAGTVDQNGDGDRDDLVVHVYEPALDRLTSTGLASAGSAALVGDWVAVSVSEAMQGSRDLDRDGEAGGNVVHVVELASGAVQDLELDAFVLHARGARLFLDPSEELAATDWNSDGDEHDRVLFDWSPGHGPAQSAPGALSAVLDVRGDVALLLADERERGGDGNGDGDDADALLELYDARNARSTPLGAAAGSFARLTGANGVLALVDELAEGRDLNGDGDLADEVVYSFDR